MKLVMSKPPLKLRLIGCYVNGIYHEFVYYPNPKQVRRKWNQQIGLLERSVNNTNNRIAKILKTDGKITDQEKQKVDEEIHLNKMHEKDIIRLRYLVNNLNKPDPYISHALEMIKMGIMEDDFVGE